jgi:mitochondrial fusion and transport protein UGO1
LTSKSTMAPITSKRRRADDEPRRPKKKIRIRKQKEYHSSSEEESDASEEQIEAKQVPKSILKQSKGWNDTSKAPKRQQDADFQGMEGLDEAQRNAALNTIVGSEEDEDDDDEDDGGDDAAVVNDQNLDEDEEEDDEDDVDDDTPSETSMTSSQASAVRKKRNDPAAFATSISKILDTKLSTAKRADPVLSRSKAASEANKAVTDSKLDAAARAQIRSERKQALQKGRITDLLGLSDAGVDTGKVMEEEKRLKKVAQRGVVKLFNAVRAAQVGAEKAAKESTQSGVVGRKQKDERVSEMSKEGFLQMISKGRSTAAT